MGTPEVIPALRCSPRRLSEWLTRCVIGGSRRTRTNSCKAAYATMGSAPVSKLSPPSNARKLANLSMSSSNVWIGWATGRGGAGVGAAGVGTGAGVVTGTGAGAATCDVAGTDSACTGVVGIGEASEEGTLV